MRLAGHCSTSSQRAVRRIGGAPTRWLAARGLPTWDVANCPECASSTPAAPRSASATSEQWLRTSPGTYGRPERPGTLRLYQDGRMFAIIGNSGGRPCAEGDTIPPIVPTARLFFPDDTGRSVAPAADSPARYYRSLIQVTFYDTTGGDQVRRAMEHWHSAIVAGGPYPTPYILRLPDPGSTWSAFDSLLGALRGEPGVQDVVPVIVRERLRP